MQILGKQKLMKTKGKSNANPPLHDLLARNVMLSDSHRYQHLCFPMFYLTRLLQYQSIEIKSTYAAIGMQALKYLQLLLYIVLP